MNEPMAYTIREAVAVSGVSRTSIYRAIQDGDVVARKHGRRTLILVDDLRNWLEKLPTIERPRKP